MIHHRLLFEISMVDRGSVKLSTITPPASDVELLSINLFPRSLSFLSQSKCHLVILSDSMEDIKDYILRDLIPKELSDRVDVIFNSESYHIEIAKKHLFKKVEFRDGGPFKDRYEEMHMSVSDYASYGKRIHHNVITNFLDADMVVDGRSLANALAGVPAIVCGRGPSLDMNMVSRYEGKAFIIACGNAIKSFKARVTPSALAYIDPFDDGKSYDHLDGDLFYQCRASPDLLKKHRGRKIWMGSSGGYPLEDWFSRISGLGSWHFDSSWNVGAFGVNIARHLGCAPIFTSGIDGGEDVSIDLVHGKKFVSNYSIPLQEFSGGVVGSWSTTPYKVRRKRIRASLKRLISEDLLKYICQYLQELQNGADPNRSMWRLESYLLGSITLEYLLAPLWEIFKDLMLQDGSNLYLQKILFFKRVLEEAWMDSDIFQDSFVIDDALFFKGKREGSIKRKNGVMSREYYEDGRRESTFKSYYPNGKLRSLYKYKNGRLHGKMQLYHSNGSLKRVSHYHNGFRDGEHVILGEDGVRHWVFQYEGGHSCL